MKRIGIIGLTLPTIAIVFVGAAFATPVVNGATIELRTFNDCALSTLTSSNDYPASIEITDAMDAACVGFANLHSFSFSEDGGATAAVFDNNANFRFGADVQLAGAGEGEGGLRISPWYGKFVDGRFMLNVTNGEIACFGGALPFYSFTVNHGITYIKGTTIRLEMTYQAHDLTAAHPATIQYRAVYNGNTYDSPVLPFGQQNPAECDPHGLYGMLNDGRAGGYFQARANTGASLTITWSNIAYNSGGECPLEMDVSVNPHTLNRASFGKWVTVYLEPEAGVPAGDIDVSSLLLNGTVAVDADAPAAVGDADADGIPDLAVKFPRTAAVATLSEGDQTVTVSGLAGGQCIRGTDDIHVMTRPASRTAALSTGSEASGTFSMLGTQPNPTRSEFGVTFSLPGNRPATLAVYDVTGRKMASTEVGGLGAGRHTVVFGKNMRLPAGVYLVQLTQDGHTLTGRATVMQ